MLQVLRLCFFSPNQDPGFPPGPAGGWQVCESAHRDQTSGHGAAPGHLHDCG